MGAEIINEIMEPVQNADLRLMLQSVTPPYWTVGCANDLMLRLPWIISTTTNPFCHFYFAF